MSLCIATCDELRDSPQAHIEHLRRENALLRHFLERTWPEGLAAASEPSTVRSAAGHWPAGRERLLPVEKYELCSLELEAAVREIHQVRADGETQQAAVAAETEDCKAQEAQLRKDVAELLKLVGLEEAVTSPSSQGVSVGAGVVQDGNVGMPLEREAAPGLASPAVSPRPHAPPVLPTAKQLALAAIPAARVEAFLEAYLSRHDASAARLQMRAGMLRAALAKLRGQQAAREGASLGAVDYEQLQIEHRQAEAAAADRAEEAVALKADAGHVLQELAVLRNRLAAAAADSTHLAQEAEHRVSEAEALAQVLARVERECQVLGRRCTEMRVAAGKHAPRVADYVQVKKSVTEAQQMVRDLGRKLEIAAVVGQARL